MKNSEVLVQMYNMVRNQIMNREIFPGTRIVEDDLAKNFGVSRAVVRGVLNQLQGEGFIKIVPNKGASVIMPTFEEIKGVYHTRQSLELGAASLAINNVSPEMIARMEANYQKQVELRKAFSITEYAKLNRAFHWEIVCASKNEYYMKYLEEMYNIVHIYMVFYDKANDNTRSLVTHGRMLDALKQRDKQMLIDAMRLDSDNGVDDLKENFGYSK